jgi:hypothetical protein
LTLDRIRELRFKQKLIVILSISFVARAIAFFGLPEDPSQLAPDEGTYAALTQWTAESKPAEKFPKYGAGLYQSSKSLILPASILYRLGFGSLDAVRIVASLYGFLSLAMILVFTLALIRITNSNQLQYKSNERTIVLLFTLFAFQPSHFIWSNLGLREAPNEFWILGAIISLFVIYHLGSKYLIVAVLLLFICIVLTFSARPQTGWLIGVTALIYLSTKLKQIQSPYVIAVVLLGVILGATGTAAIGGATRTTLAGVPGAVLNLTDVVPTKHKDNQLEAASIIKTPWCPFEQTSEGDVPPERIDLYLCILWRAPYMSSTFLFRPFIATDVTSTASFIAALENIFWTIVVLFIVFLITKRRGIPYFDKLMPSLVFFALYVIGAGAYEGNMGTAFRHKSLILWVVLAVLLALFWKDPQETTRKSSNMAPESAV